MVKRKRIKFKGVPASPGVVIGKVYLFDVSRPKIKRYRIPPNRVEDEIKAFKTAVAETRKQIEELRDRIHEGMGREYGEIFGAHLLILDDPFLLFEVVKKIKEECVNVEHALWEVLEKVTSSISSLEDEYLKERAADIHDIGRRILENLIKSKRSLIREIEEEVVVIAHSLAPSDTAQMHKEKVIGFATDVGSRTSHAAIMARALEIPAVVGLKDLTQHAKDGDMVVIDGIHGEVILNPRDSELKQYTRKQKEYVDFVAGLAHLRELPAQTKDGWRVSISANIEIQEEVHHVRKHGAEGIGLYRTEFLYLNRTTLPSEEEQFETYMEVAETLYPYPLTIRTLDIGGDKFVPHLANYTQEPNPFLGLRAIRLCLEHPDIFKTQLRAILRASRLGNLRVIFPMITTIDEFRMSKGIFEEVKEELRTKEIEFDEGIKVGIMIETPSAALTSDILAKEADFFSIGTNDLIQYTLAVDRANESIAHLYEPSHPAILRLVKRTIEAAHSEGKLVEMCGEMAANPLFIPILLGLGLDGFSMSGVVIPEIKEIIRSLTLDEAKVIAEDALKLTTTEGIIRLIKRRLGRRFKHIFEEVGEM